MKNEGFLAKPFGSVARDIEPKGVVLNGEKDYKLNGQICLVGDALAFAELADSKTSEIEKDMEVSLEGIEELANKYTDEDVVKRATELCSTGTFK